MKEKILRALLESYPKVISVSELAEALGYGKKGYANVTPYLIILENNGIIEVEKDRSVKRRGAKPGVIKLKLDISNFIRLWEGYPSLRPGMADHWKRMLEDAKDLTPLLEHTIKGDPELEEYKEDLRRLFQGEDFRILLSRYPSGLEAWNMREYMLFVLAMITRIKVIPKRYRRQVEREFDMPSGLFNVVDGWPSRLLELLQRKGIPRIARELTDLYTAAYQAGLKEVGNIVEILIHTECKYSRPEYKKAYEEALRRINRNRGYRITKGIKWKRGYFKWLLEENPKTNIPRQMRNFIFGVVREDKHQKDLSSFFSRVFPRIRSMLS